MFAKIKSIWASVKATFINRMVEMSIELEAMGALKTAVSDVETEFNIVKDKIESLVEPAVAKVEAQVQAAAPVVVAAVKTDVGGFLLKLRDALAIFDAVPAEFDTFAAPIIKAGGSDIEDALTKIAKILDYKGVKSALWGEIVAVVKVL